MPVTAIRSGTDRITVYVANPTHRVALMIHLNVIRARWEKRVLPTFYEDNYFSLLPGERRTVSIEFTQSSFAGEPLALTVGGWNLVPQKILIGDARR